MTGRCYAGPPDENGHGGCRAYDRSSKLPAECWSSALLCDLCLEVAERDVRALVLDYRDLEQHLPPSLGVWQFGSRGGADSPLPLRSSVLDLQIDIWWLCTAWCDVVREADRLSDAPSHVRSGWAVQDAVKILAPRLRLLAEIESATMWDYPSTSTPADRCSEVPGWRGVLDLAELHQRARRALGLTNAMPVLMKGVPCRACDRRALYRLPVRHEKDPVTVECDACGERYGEDEYADWQALNGAAVCGRRNGDWWCALARKHDGECEPYRREEAA